MFVCLFVGLLACYCCSVVDLICLLFVCCGLCVCALLTMFVIVAVCLFIRLPVVLLSCCAC